jgi:hypothetical protein
MHGVSERPRLSLNGLQQLPHVSPAIRPGPYLATTLELPHPAQPGASSHWETNRQHLREGHGIPAPCKTLTAAKRSEIARDDEPALVCEPKHRTGSRQIAKDTDIRAIAIYIDAAVQAVEIG